MSSEESTVFHNADRWVEKNKEFFLPPVCNKMMHQEGQMKMFFVGGPNQRKDYHIEEGEEFFYQIKGQMCLKVVEQGKHRDIYIKEGQVFLLPGKIAHSPNRVADTVGVVIERERHLSELDGLRYYTEKDGKPTLESLYEEWFYCSDLGKELAPIIKRYFASEQFKTGVPLPGTIPEKPPIVLDSKTKLQDPFDLEEWLDRNNAEIQKRGCKPLFEGNHQFQIDVLGQGEHSDQVEDVETLIWQLRGTSSVTVNGKTTSLADRDTLLVKAGQRWTMNQNENSLSLLLYQDPARKNTL